MTSNLTVSILPNHPVTKWVDQNYRQLWRTHSFVVMVLKGGELDRMHPIAAN